MDAGSCTDLVVEETAPAGEGLTAVIEAVSTTVDVTTSEQSTPSGGSSPGELASGNGLLN